MTPELQAWLQANSLWDPYTESDPYNLNDYGQGSVIGNSGLYRQADEPDEAFLSRLYQSAMGNGEWGTAGRGFDDLQNAGFFNTLDPVDIGGKSYQRVGEDVSKIDLNRLGPKQRAEWEKRGVSKLGINDPRYGGMIPYDDYVALSQAAAADKPANNPLEAFGKTIGPAMGLSGLINSLGGFGFQSLGSSLAENAASQGGSFSDVLGSFGLDSAAVPDTPWGVNPKDTGFGDAASWMGEEKLPLGYGGPNFADLAGPGSFGPAFPGLTGGPMQMPATTTPPIPLGGMPENISAATGAGAAATAAKSALGKILEGTATADDWLKIGGSLGSTALGIFGANSQADAIKDASQKQVDAYTATADKFLGLGAPYRDRLDASYKPGFDLTKQDPAFQGAMDQASSSVLRGLSASTGGNPFDNPGAVMEANKYVTQNVALPQLNTYRSQLGSFGGLGVNAAGTAGLGAANASGGTADNNSGIYNALGYGLGQLTSGDNDFASILKKYQGVLGGNAFSLNNGMSF